MFRYGALTVAEHCLRPNTSPDTTARPPFHGNPWQQGPDVGAVSIAIMHEQSDKTKEHVAG